MEIVNLVLFFHWSSQEQPIQLISMQMTLMIVLVSMC